MDKVNRADAKRWAKKQAEFIVDNPEYTAAYELDYGLCIAMGFMNGFDTDDDSGITSTEYPSAKLCMKVATYNPYDLDFEYMDMPYDEITGDVWDTETSFSFDDIDSTVDWLIDKYYEIIKHSDELVW